MKKIGEYTAKGSVKLDQIHRIILDDGQFDTGYRITEFVIAPHDMDNSSSQVYSGKLYTDDSSGMGRNWNWDANDEIAWSIFTYDGNLPRAQSEFTLVDPDNLVIQDLFVTITDNVQTIDKKVNYFIRMEKYDITDSQGALAMVRNRSQA